MSFAPSASAKLVSWRLLLDLPPTRQAQVDRVYGVVNGLLEGLEVNLGWLGMIKAKDAQCCGDVRARTNGYVLEAT
jgi:hypothetical protein